MAMGDAFDTSAGVASSALQQQLRDAVQRGGMDAALMAASDLFTRTTPAQRTTASFVQRAVGAQLGDADIFAPGGLMDTLVPVAGTMIASNNSDTNNPNTKAMLNGMAMLGLEARIVCAVHDQVTGTVQYDAARDLEDFLAEAIAVAVYPASDTTNPVQAPTRLSHFRKPGGNYILPFQWQDNDASIILTRSRAQGLSPSVWGWNIPGTPANLQRIQAVLIVDALAVALNLANRTFGTYGLTLTNTGIAVTQGKPIA